jgi:hypothetical protein
MTQADSSPKRARCSAPTARTAIEATVPASPIRGK